ncbi:MFS transporter [Haloarcula sp. JP-L23]|uniref:MFS transporter n=1 Tax=Haloarcula sp. JP-L23 TaxID=2716717 RepID=UPI00140F0D18|nr:MFS transporter [Haloarcula sp. JP-L23]
MAIIAVGWLSILGVRFLVPALLPQVKSTFGVDNTTASIAVTAVWTFYALTQFPAGLITDHVGERVALTVSLFVSAGSLVLLFGSPVFALFVGASILVWLLLTDPIDALADTSAGERTAASPVREAVGGIPKAIGDRRLLLTVLGLTFYLFTYQGLTAFFPTYLIAHEHVGRDLALGMFALLFVGGDLTQLVAGSLADRYGAPSVLVGVTLVGVVSLVAVPLVDGRVTWVAISPLLRAHIGIAPVANS